MTPTRIREMLSYATHTRRELQRKPIPAFLADALVGELLQKCIADLKALSIPTRLHAERMLREAEIGACEDTLRIWLAGRGQSAPVKRIEPAPPITCDFETESSVPVTLVEFVNIGEAIAEARREPEERVYGRGGVVLRVIDGGKK